MNVNRRIFLKQGALAFVCLGAGPMWGPKFLRQAAFATDLSSASSPKKILICIFQRGAVDGLSMVVPYGDPFYYQNRTDIAVAAPSSSAAGTALDLDGYFGLNPAMAPLLPLFKQGQLAAIQACGSPNSSRSHFTSQDLMESGIDTANGVTDGWLNRLIGYCPEDDANNAFRAVSMTSAVPRSLQGEHDALAIRDLDTFGLSDGSSLVMAGGSGGGEAGFENMYGSAVDTVLHGTARESFDALAMLKNSSVVHAAPANGAAYPGSTFGRNLRQIAQLIKANVGLQIAFAEVDGWDTHNNQGTTKGQLATRLGDFSQALAALHQDLGDRMADVAVITMSEFGRTVHQNGNRGTDHGHGTCFFTMGGGIKGGKVYGDWPTLAPDKLFENRDLAITTDFRDVFAEIATRHCGVGSAAFPQLFPNYTVDQKNFRNFCTS
jgi:uncharacterized protein (DUF1501 family)